MFKTLALTALAAAPASVNGDGCYPTWRSGSDYSSGSYVSATVTTETAASGETVTTASQKKNFKCISGSQSLLSHCPSYDPADINSGAVWSDQGVCSENQPLGTLAPTPKPTHATWSGVGCPKTWISGGSYIGGELAEVNGMVYQCSTAEAVNAWCGNSDYKPGDSSYWVQVWTLLGSCEGTISPTSSPNYQSLADHGGCPNEFTFGTAYEEGDKVTVGSIVYQCRSWPYSVWCSMSQWEPGSVFSKEAWTILGYCEGETDLCIQHTFVVHSYRLYSHYVYCIILPFLTGTMAPTASPAFSFLVDVGGCPLSYDSNGRYEEGDEVSVEGNGMVKFVYKCKAPPNDRYCNQYEPGHWSELGWTLDGYCEGELRHQMFAHVEAH